MKKMAQGDHSMTYQEHFIYEPGKITLRDDTGEQLAAIEFPALSAQAVNITRTFVAPSLRGEGVADQLMQAACQTAENEGKKILPTCSYAVRWFEAHPEYAAILTARD
jgi:predicted GNAT family acetyltransferase